MKIYFYMRRKCDRAGREIPGTRARMQFTSRGLARRYRQGDLAAGWICGLIDVDRDAVNPFVCTPTTTTRT